MKYIYSREKYLKKLDHFIGILSIYFEPLIFKGGQ